MCSVRPIAGRSAECVPARSGWSPNPRWLTTPWACSLCAYPSFTPPAPALPRSGLLPSGVERSGVSSPSPRQRRSMDPRWLFGSSVWPSCTWFSSSSRCRRLSADAISVLLIHIVLVLHSVRSLEIVAFVIFTLIVGLVDDGTPSDQVVGADAMFGPICAFLQRGGRGVSCARSLKRQVVGLRSSRGRRV
jgi:hypothetical protein